MASDFKKVVATLFLSFSFQLGQCDNNFNSLLSSVKLRLSEFPPISNSSINARSIAIFNSTNTSILSFDIVLSHLSKYSSKIYVEARPGSNQEFVSFLNLTASYIENILWMPCIMLYWPEKVKSSEEAEITVLKIVDRIDKKDFPLDSEIFVAFEIVVNDFGTTSHSNVVLCDLFKYKREITSTSQFCHIRQLDKPLSLSEGYFSYHPVSSRRRDLNGTTLNIIAQYDPSYEERISLREFDNGTIEFTKGFCLDVLIALQITMNFSYIPMKGNGWVGQLANGTPSGMVAQLINKEADLSIAQASMIMMINVLPGISFLQATSTGQFVALFRQPSSSANLHLSVFSKDSWLFYFITWIILVVAVHFAFWIQKSLNMNLSGKDIAFPKDVFFWVVTTACTKGLYKPPRAACFRAICLIASIMAYCIYAAYSSQLTVMLVTEVLPIKSFSELALSRLGIFTDKWLPVARNLIEKVYSQRGVEIPMQNSELYTAVDGIHAVIKKDSSLAFVTFADTVTSVLYNMNLTDNYFCNAISFVKVASQTTPTGMFVRRRSPLKEILNYNIINLLETGITKRLNNQYEDRTQILCAPQLNNYRGGLSLKDAWTPFAIIAIGCSLCLLNMLFETLCSRSFT